VKNPAGRTIGYLDISMHAERELVSTIALLQTLVESIEDKLSRLSFDYAGQRAGLLSPLPPEIKRDLTPREREVLQLLLAGLTNEEIAEKLSLSIETVKTHRRNIYRKLSVKNSRKFLRKLRKHPFKSDIHL
jgi:DNA-binding NarL/FixJ family response regulator